MDKKTLPLMPKSAAVWLIDNSKLTFEQIAAFCGLHVLEIQNIADGEIAKGMMGMSPFTTGQITIESLKASEENSNLPLKLSEKYLRSISSLKPEKKKYTPLLRRRDKPDAILWLIKNCPSIKDLEIVKLVGTTKQTIESIKNGEYWNAANIRPRDPVLLGICTQIDLNKIVEKTNNRKLDN